MNGKSYCHRYAKLYINQKERYKMNMKPKSEIVRNYTLFEYLSKLNSMQLKIFYGAFVHYWVHHKVFISKQNFFNLWCDLNSLCHEVDESFPDQYDDREVIKSFCLAYPYYFINILPAYMIARLFAEYVDDRVDILTNIAKEIYEADIHSAYTYANNALNLEESVDTLVVEALDHIKHFS